MPDERSNTTKARIQLLEEENKILSQNLEDFLLANSLNLYNDDTLDVKKYLDKVLEKFGVLKNIQFSIFLKFELDTFSIISTYSTRYNLNIKQFSTNHNSSLANIEDYKHYLLNDEEKKEVLSLLNLDIENQKN